MQGEMRQSGPAQRARRQSRAQQVQKRRFTLSVCLLCMVVVVTAVASYSSRAEAASDTAVTSPSVMTDTSTSTAIDPSSATYVAELVSGPDDFTSGQAVFTLDYDAATETISYSLDITSPLANPSVATICQGDPGQIGTAVFTIFAGPTIAGNFSGVLSQGDIAASSLTGSLAGGQLCDLVSLLNEGKAYVTIGTASAPLDAIRGQIQ